jgi:hypothetical protein
MKQIHGLKNLTNDRRTTLNAQKLAALLQADLQQCRLTIFGCVETDDKVVLAELHVLTDSLEYRIHEQRLDFCVCGPILRADAVPLTYRLQGKQFAITGRCSMIAKVCGVDLYLQRSYTGKVGDIARQNFSLYVSTLLKTLA